MVWEKERGQEDQFDPKAAHAYSRNSYVDNQVKEFIQTETTYAQPEV